MISIFYGTRPEYIKLYKLYQSIKNMHWSVELVQIQQHTDLIEGCYYDRIFCLNKKTSNRLNDVVVNCLSDGVLTEKTKYVIVQGDTATTFGIAVNAFNNKIPLIHIEAGLRTHDKENPFPEESYRKAISGMADVHFCVSELNAQSLKNEGIVNSIFVVGNTVLDNLDNKNVHYGNIVPITLHRRENKDKIESFLSTINFFAKGLNNLKFIYITHPSVSLSKKYDYITLIPPQKYEDMINLLKEARYVITDSGGIQEEASFFKKKTIVCRKTTERTEGLGVFSLKYENLDNLSNLICEFNTNFKVDADCPYGDGFAIQKILTHMKDLYGEKLY
jgi:UDP-N-acetylglucosamine 2-epimerase (non-hydrolysing)